MTPRRKVFGIVPPTGKFIREDRCQTPIKNLKTVSLRPPIDLLYCLGAFEAAGCECRLVDYPGEEVEWDRLEADLLEFRPEVLLLSITTPSLEDDLKAAALAKRVDPNVVTLAKGAHFNTLDRRALEAHPALDAVLRGEYEETCREIGEGRSLEAIAGITRRAPDGAIARNPDRGPIEDLNSVAYPARHLANNALYLRPDTGELQTTLVTNRGCPFHCVYCLANQVSGVKNRYRSIENVMGEIRDCVERHGIRNFLFRSDLFTQNRRWVKDLCQAILDEKLDIDWACNSRVDTLDADVLAMMKRAGCWIIAFGVESGDQQTLDRIDKAAKVEDAEKAIRLTREAGIKSSVYLLMGLPWDDRPTIENLERYAIELDPDVLEIFYAYPFPGTPLYDTCVELGLLEAGAIPRQAYDSPAMPSLHLSIEELQTLRRRAMRRFYLRPSKIARTLRSAGSARQLMNYGRLGWAQLVDLLTPQRNGRAGA